MRDIRKNGEAPVGSIGWRDLAKVAGVVMASISLTLFALNFLELNPAVARDAEARLTRIESAALGIARDVNDLTNNMKITYAAAVVEHTDFNKRLTSLEAHQFTVKEGAVFQKDLMLLRAQVEALQSEEWSQRIRAVENFLQRHYPEEFKP